MMSVITKRVKGGEERSSVHHRWTPNRCWRTEFFILLKQWIETSTSLLVPEDTALEEGWSGSWHCFQQHSTTSSLSTPDKNKHV